MPDPITHPSPSLNAPSTYKTWQVAILGALAGCFLIAGAVWLGRGTIVAEVLFLIPCLATMHLLSWILAPLVSMLVPEGGPPAGVLLASMGVLIFWALLFGGASAWWYRRQCCR